MHDGLKIALVPIALIAASCLFFYNSPRGTKDPLDPLRAILMVITLCGFYWWLWTL
jgi:uncharacterized membrane protein